MIKFRNATTKDAHAFYGKAPSNTFKGVVAVKGEEVIGIGGVFYMQSHLVAFSDMKPEMRKYKKSIVKGVRLIMKMVKEAGRPVYTIACPDEPTASKLLEGLGFKPTGLRNEIGETLIWEDKS